MNPTVFDVNIVHADCWCIDTSNKVDCMIKEGHNFNVNNGVLTVETELTGPNTFQAIKKIKSHPVVKNVDVKFRVGDTARLQVTSLYNPTIMKKVVASGCSYVGECVTENGVDKLMLIAPPIKNFTSFCDRKNEKTEVVLKARKNFNEKDFVSMKSFNASSFFKLQSAANLLSIKQKKIFDCACKMGYYSVPKKITLSELANSLGLSESTAREHLRKAESKLYPTISDLVKLV